MVTGYEREYYMHVGQIARTISRIVELLEKISTRLEENNTK